MIRRIPCNIHKGQSEQGNPSVKTFQHIRFVILRRLRYQHILNCSSHKDTSKDCRISCRSTMICPKENMNRFNIFHSSKHIRMKQHWHHISILYFENYNLLKESLQYKCQRRCQQHILSLSSAHLVQNMSPLLIRSIYIW